MKEFAGIEGKRVNFWLMAKPGSHVFVAGTFNNWDPKANPLHDSSSRGHFKAGTHIASGKHEYKFVVNGIWQADPSCLQRTPDQFGAENCVIEV